MNQTSPTPLPADEPADQRIVSAFSRLSPLALGLAIGAVLGSAILAATLYLVAKGGEQVGPHLSLIGQYFSGYTVTVKGSLVGLLYGFLSGFIMGCVIAALRNALLRIYLWTVKFKASLDSANEYMDHM